MDESESTWSSFLVQSDDRSEICLVRVNTDQDEMDSYILPRIENDDTFNPSCESLRDHVCYLLWRYRGDLECEVVNMSNSMITMKANRKQEAK